MATEQRYNTLQTFLLTTCRFLAGGALLIAGIIKLRDPSNFMLSINSFELLPEAIIPFMAFAVPWTETLTGLLLLYGGWSRSAAVIATGLYSVFTIALLFVLWNELPVDCGCFGGLFGSETVGWGSIMRNTILTISSVMVIVFGGGSTAIENMTGTRSTLVKETNESPIVAEQIT